ncbi:hypothetical protein K466DRAFT_408070 [Polyporus arcularius HHB13444]|uniref:Uncharacterized protein n=1 Tax=Polyporus arcularius HHB13444 TaxID=1314778 RepID=A0A5C3P276_9APHY|nr:hypothetical protein K466DRAFT_408070 [Polyporus arcularius HHB13444]
MAWVCREFWPAARWYTAVRTPRNERDIVVIEENKGERMAEGERRASQIGWDAKQPGCRMAAPPRSHYSGAVAVSTDARTRTNLDHRELVSISLLCPDQRRPPDRSCTAEARGSALSTSSHGDDGRFRIQSENAWDRRRPQSHVPVFASSVTLAELSWTGAGLRFNPPPGRSGTCSPAPADDARPPQSSSGRLRRLSRIPGAFDTSAPDADLEERLTRYAT